jgi:transcriptional regulator with XRE-family HTH domain/mannose-6-phosphate isomerase-like protein (cupin superfamily)
MSSDGRRRPAANGHTGSSLGERLRNERAARGLSLRELARRLGVSPSLVSQIETGRIFPSVGTLYAIVRELGVSIDEIFVPDDLGPVDGTAHEPPAAVPMPMPRPVVRRRADPAPAPVLRAADRAAIQLEAGVRWERLTARTEEDVEFIYTVYSPGGESAPADEPIDHGGREFGIVVRGTLEVTVGDDDFTLGPGDTVFFDSTIPHRLHNPGGEDTHAIWVVLGRQQVVRPG